MLYLYVEYSRHAVARIFGQWHMPIMWNVCILVFQVTLLIALSSCEVYILTQLSHIFTWTNLICGISGAYLFFTHVLQWYSKKKLQFLICLFIFTYVPSVGRLQCIDTYVQCHKPICSGTYANNVKCNHWLQWTHMRYLYWHRCVICGILRGIFVAGPYMAITWEADIEVGCVLHQYGKMLGLYAHMSY